MEGFQFPPRDEHVPQQKPTPIAEPTILQRPLRSLNSLNSGNSPTSANENSAAGIIDNDVSARLGLSSGYPNTSIQSGPVSGFQTTSIPPRSSSEKLNVSTAVDINSTLPGLSVISASALINTPPTASARHYTALDQELSSSLGAIKSNAVPIVLQAIFAKFVHAAESKVDSLLSYQLDRDTDISSPLNPGVDLAFDRLLYSIASIAKCCPKLIIDSIMVWRKSKGDQSMTTVPDHIRMMYPQLKSKDLLTILKERKSLLANFVLCRVLTTIISQLGKNTLPNDLGEKLEDMVFGQLKNSDPDLVVKSVNRQANVDMFAELIGALSNIRFATVSDRFISEIGRGAAPTKETKLELIIRSMRFLKLKIYPMDCLEETAEFLQTSADLFQDTHNIHVKHAYANLFVELLDPIASIASAEVNLPAWQKTVDTIYPKAARMVHKSRHLPAALPLISTLLCVSKREFFLKNWFDFVQLLIKRFKEKGDTERELKQIAFVSLTRLIWVYLFRCFESPALTVQRRVDEILRVLFPANKRGVVPTDCDTTSFVRIVYFVLVKYSEYGNEIINMLLGPSSLNNLPSISLLLTSSATSQISYGSSEADLSYGIFRNTEVLPNPERLLIAFRSFILFLSDVEVSLGDPQGSSLITAGTVSAVQSGSGMVVVEGKINLPSPRFPDHHSNKNGTSSSLQNLAHHAQHNIVFGSEDDAVPISKTTTNCPTINGYLSEEILVRMGSSIRETLETINSVVGRALLFLDQTLGNVYVMDRPSMGFEFPECSSGGTIGSSNSFHRRPSVNVSDVLQVSLYAPMASVSVLAGLEKDKPTITELFVKIRPHLDLLCSVLECLPRYTPLGITPLKVIEVISRLLVHLDDNVRREAFAALCRIARIKTSSTQHTFWFTSSSLESISASVLRISTSVCMSIIGHRFADLCVSEYAYKCVMHCVSSNFVGLAEIWFENFIEQADGPLQSFDRYECSWVIDEIESRGLVFLTMGRPACREMAIKAFRLANTIDTKLEELKAKRSADPNEQKNFEYSSTLNRNRPLLAEDSSTLLRLTTLHGNTRNTLQRKKAVQQTEPIQEESESDFVYPAFPDSESFHHKRNLSVSNAPDEAQKHQTVRIITIMENCGQELLKKHFFDSLVGSSARPDPPKIQQQNRRYLLSLLAKPDCFATLAISENYRDKILWNQCFPDFLKWVMDYASPKAVKRSIIDMFLRIRAMHNTICTLADPQQTPTSSKGMAGSVNKWAMERVSIEKRAAASNTSTANLLNTATNTNMNNNSNFHFGVNGSSTHPNNHGQPGNTNDSTGSGNDSNSCLRVDFLINQWKSCLVFVATCYSPIKTSTVQGRPSTSSLNRASFHSNKSGVSSMNNGSGPTTLPQHGSRTSISGERDAHTRHHINNATALFNIDELIQLVTPLLWCENVSIRQIASLALGSVHPNCFGRLLVAIQPTLHTVIEDMRSRSISGKFEPMSKANFSQPQALFQIKRLERVRMEVTHMLSLIAEFVEYDVYRLDPTIMTPILDMIRSLIQFLSDSEIQLEWDHQMLRYYFCCFISKFYHSLVTAVGSSRPTASGTESIETYIPFALRLELVLLFESWCGFGLNSDMTRDREARMMKVVLEQVKDISLRATVTSTLEEQRKALEAASLKSIASLCNGPISSKDNAYLQLDLSRLIIWINAILGSPHVEYHPIARKTIEHLLSNNISNERLIEELLKQCYNHQKKSKTDYMGTHDESKLTLAYFMAFVDLVCRQGRKASISVSKILCLALYNISSDSSQRRKGAARLLLSVDRHMFGSGGDGSALAADVRNMFDRGSQSSEMLISRMDSFNMDDEPLELGGAHDEDIMDGLMISEDDLLREVQATYETAAITSSLPLVFKYAQGMVSKRLAIERPELTYEMFSELIHRIYLLADISLYQPRIRDLLLTLSPWLQNMDLDGRFNYDVNSDQVGSRVPESENQLHAQAITAMVLGNLFYLTTKFGDIFITDIELLWVHLVDLDGTSHQNHQASRQAWEEKNIGTIVDYLLLVGLERRNPRFVAIAKKIAVCICRTPSCGTFIEIIISKITPKNMVTNPDNISALLSQQCPYLQGYFTASINDALSSMPERPPFSPGQIAFTCLVEVAIEVGNFALRPHLPLLLHAIFVQLDHFLFLICEQARSLLVNIIQAMLPRETRRESIDATLTALNLKEGKRLWTYEDVSPSKPTIDSVYQLSALVLEVLDLFHTIHPTLRQTWGVLALSWGTECPVRHIACRSLQVFRALRPVFTQNMVGDLLARLSVTLGDSSEDVQGYTLELIETLQWMVSHLSDDRLVYFPQFFWASIAIIQSSHECEFEMGAHLLENIISRLDLSDARISSLLLANLPTRWKGEFYGLQPLILQGMCSSKTEMLSLNIINKLMLLPASLLIDASQTSRVLFSVLANLPRLLHEGSQDALFAASANATGEEDDHIKPVNQPQSSSSSSIDSTSTPSQLPIKESCTIASYLAHICKINNHIGLSRVHEMYSKKRFRSMDEFMRQLASVIRESFFPKWETKVLHFLMSLLRNTMIVYREHVLVCLRVLFPDGHTEGAFRLGADMLRGHQKVSSQSGIESGQVGFEEEWIQPLLDLLDTDLALVATKALDKILTGRVSLNETNLSLVFGGKTIYKIAKDAAANSLASNISSANGQGKGGSFSGKVSSYFHEWRVKDPTKSAMTAKYNMSGVAMTCSGSFSVMSHDSADVTSELHSRIPTYESSVSSLAAFSCDPGQSNDDLTNTKSLSSLQNATLDPMVDQLDDTGFLALVDDLQHFFNNVLQVDLEPAGHLKKIPMDKNVNVDTTMRLKDLPKHEDAFQQDEFVDFESTPSQRNFDRSSLLASIIAPLDKFDFMYELGSPASSTQRDDSTTPTLQLNLDKPAFKSRQSNTITPAQRILARPNSKVTVSFYLGPNSYNLVDKPEFEYWIRVDIMACLRLPGVEYVELIRIEKSGFSISNEQAYNAKQFDASTLADQALSRVLIVVAIIGPQERSGFESAAYAEELAALLSQKSPDFNEEQQTLSSGVVMRNVDRTWQPELSIEFSGLSVPYIPEGLRPMGLHQSHISQPQSITHSGQHRDQFTRHNPSSFTSSQVYPNIQSNDGTRAHTIVDALAVFSDAFEFSRQLQIDFLDLVGNAIDTANSTVPLGETLKHICDKVQSVLINGNEHAPIWAGPDSAQIFESIADKLEYQDKTKPGFLNRFMNTRQERMQELNSIVAQCMSTRQAIDDILAGQSDSNGNLTVLMELLGNQIMSMSGVVGKLENGLESVLEGFEARRF
ncbi:hypothetical protein BDV3_005299 [Batrachochytrium dendrobatidis]